MTMTPLPSPPSTSDPSNFAAKADAFIAALVLFQTEANALPYSLNPTLESILISNAQIGTTIIQAQNTNSGGAVSVQSISNVANAVLSVLGSTFGGTTYGGVNGSSQVLFEADAASSFYIGTSPACPIIFAQNRVEKMRLEANGDFVVGYITAGGVRARFLTSTAAQTAVLSENSHGTPTGVLYDAVFSGAAPNNTTAEFFRGIDTSSAKIIIYSNGNIANQNNVYGAISARALKQDIAPVEHASVWDTVKSLSENSVTYKLKSDVLQNGPDAQVLTGGIAEDWEGIDPDLVFEDGKTGTKCINYSGAFMRSLVALGSALKRIEALETKVGI